MKANPSAPEGLALEGASAVLRGLHPLPCRANAAHAEYSDRLLGSRVAALPAEAATMLAMAVH
jgi:hypothetical protein